jgi:hypothetical protein
VSITFHIIPIIISSLLSFSVLALWFSPALFGNLWLKLLAIQSTDAHQYINFKTFGFAALFIIIFNVGMEIIVDQVGAVGMNPGIGVGLMIGIFVSLAHCGILLTLEQKPKLLLLIYSGYYIVISVISAALMAMWR